MKICFLYHHPYNILQNDTRVLKEAKSLISSGNDVIIIYGNPDMPGKGSIYAYDIKIQCRSAWFSKPKSLMFFLWAVISSFNTLLKYLGISNLQSSLIHVAEGYKIKADVYHAHDFQTLLGGYILKKLTGAKLVYDEHEYLTDCNYYSELNPLSKMIVKELELFLSKRCDGVIATTEPFAQLMANQLHIKKPTILRNLSLYINDNDLIKNKKDIRNKIGISQDHLVILYLGWAVKSRGLDIIIRLAREFPSNHFVIMGKIDSQSDIDKSLSNLHYLAPVPSDEVIYWAVSADIGLYPMINESLNHYYSIGNKIGEYIMAMLPMAVSNFPEMKKIIELDSLGITFDPEDFNSIVNALKYITQPTVLKEIKERVKSNRFKYSWNNEEINLIKLYASL